MNFWFDEDGVLVVYEPHAYKGDNPLYLRKGEHYFASLVPDNKMITVTKKLQEKMNEQDNLYILTTVSPLGDMFTEQVKDKKEWLRLRAPHIDVDTNFFPSVSDKRDMAAMLMGSTARTLSKKDVLIDDWNPNLQMWEKHGGTAIKYLNGINSADSWAGLKITEEMTADEIVEMLLSLDVPSF